MSDTGHTNGLVLNTPTVNAHVCGVTIVAGSPGDPDGLAVQAPTGVTAGAPGAFVPSVARLPADLAALNDLGALGQTTAWTVGQYVELDDESDAYWDGEDWQEGTAPTGPPTGVTAGIPGAFTPEGATVPANITALRALDLLEDGVDPAWTEGQYVVIGSGNVHWDGSDWSMGAAPGD